MTKAEDLVNQYYLTRMTIQTRLDSIPSLLSDFPYLDTAKECAMIAVKNEYKSLREMLFNLRACHAIENEQVYLTRLERLNNEEQEVIEGIKKL